MRKFEIVALLILGGGLILGACGGPAQPTAAPAQPTAAPAPSQIKVLRIGVVTYPDVIDPQKSSVVNEINILQLAYEGLVRLDEKGSVQAGSADKWEKSADGKTITFHIRDGLKRWDGTPMGCADFEYALKREVDPFTSGRLYSSIVRDIKGAQELLDYGDTTAPDNMDRQQVGALYANYGVHCTDQQTLQVELDSPIGFWEYIASTWVTFPAD
ncbi:MAG: hypothetical protein HY741_25635 [Chloroflexi bacterium]|nr:hypothetical protein [Chloroflexota bacterium]